ncbi:MAG: hypothetical protein OER21_08755 [Gemmatimonadota bacterium]|nr:hypothetical protein [Gemmatimonadota bacterium]
MANVAFALSIVDLARSFMQFELQKEIARVEGLLERQLIFRRPCCRGTRRRKWATGSTGRTCSSSAVASSRAS